MLTKPSPCSGKYILPGGIDMNVHLQRPAYGTQTIDDFYQVFSINSINAWSSFFYYIFQVSA